MRNNREADFEEKQWADRMVDLIEQKPRTLALCATNHGLKAVWAKDAVEGITPEQADELSVDGLPEVLGHVEIVMRNLATMQVDDLNEKRLLNAQLISACKVAFVTGSTEGLKEVLKLAEPGGPWG